MRKIKLLSIVFGFSLWLLVFCTIRLTWLRSQTILEYEPTRTELRTKIPELRISLPSETKWENQRIFDKIEQESNVAFNFHYNWNLFRGSKLWRDRLLEPLDSSLMNVTYCENVQFTSPLGLHYNNRYWQVLTIHSVRAKRRKYELYLYNAYYDNRDGLNVVRVISVTNQQQQIDQEHFK